MKQYICQITSGSFTWTKVYYDGDENTFYREEYHCGVIDPGDEHLDWQGAITKAEAFKLLVRGGCLGILSRYYNADSDSDLLDKVLLGMDASCRLNHPSDYQGDRHDTYYMFPGGDTVIFHNGTYFSTRNTKFIAVDFNSVKDIVSNSDRVTVSTYNYAKHAWETTAVRYAKR